MIIIPICSLNNLFLTNFVEEHLLPPSKSLSMEEVGDEGTN